MFCEFCNGEGVVWEDEIYDPEGDVPSELQEEAELVTPQKRG